MKLKTLKDLEKETINPNIISKNYLEVNEVKYIFKKLKAEAVKGLISAMDDVQHGRYTILEKNEN